MKPIASTPRKPLAELVGKVALTAAFHAESLRSEVLRARRVIAGKLHIQ